MISPVLACALVVGVSAPASAQSRGAVEVGGQVVALRLSGPTVTKPDEPFMDVGFGGRGAWIFNNTLAVEVASDFFPTNRHNVLRGGRKFEMLAGPKFGWRSERIGVFAKARAGIARIGEGKQEGVCVALAIFPPPEGCLVAENRLAFDIGGGVEVYPTPRTSVRVDAADLITRVSRTSFYLGSRPNYSHWLQISTGYGVRF